MTDLQPMVYTPVSAVANLRRSSIIAAVLGVLAIAVSAIDGRPLIGVFAALGLALGAINNRMLQRSVIAHGLGTVTKKKFRGGVFLRLGGITMLSIAAALVVYPDGLATFGGLAVFQVLMLVGAAVPVFRSLRPSA